MRLKEIKPGMVVHCKTQEEANQLCDAVGGSGNWKEYWIHNEDDTCYQILSNGISSYGKSISYGSKIITEFSDLVIPELSAEEALLAYDQMCSENYYCSDCPIYGILGHECARKMDGHITEIVDAVKKWKADREKNDPEAEKKEPKIETVEFSDLIIPDPELSAEEALLAYDQMCSENYCCSDCPIYGILGHKCARKMDGHITEIVDAIKKWKADREKNDPEAEKKEPEIEWFWKSYAVGRSDYKEADTEQEAMEWCEYYAKEHPEAKCTYKHVCRVKDVK